MRYQAGDDSDELDDDEELTDYFTWVRRDRKKKLKMRISGSSVKDLARIAREKSLHIKRRREQELEAKSFLV